MARKKRATLWADADAKFTGAGNKWEGQELDDTIDDIVDSVAFEDEIVAATPSTYNCASGNLQVMTLTGNSTLTVSNAEAGRYYTLIKKGNFTLTLPTSEFSASGSTVPVGTAIITFMSDGTDLYFNYSTYAAT